MLIIYNPTAGRRRAQRLWLVLDILAESGVRFDVIRTNGPGHATILAREAANTGTATVVAAGGDGTIADVAAGLNGSGTSLGIIPLGTANVLAHELRLDFAPPAIAAVLAFGRGREIWPGIATGANGSRLFVQMVGAGFDAQVVHRIQRPLKRLLGRGAYVVQTLIELAGYQFPPLSLIIDGEPITAGSVIVSKGRLYAGNYLLAPHASPFQPGFTVAIFRNTGPFHTLLYGAALPLDLLPHMAGVELRTARQIEISARPLTPVQADGDAAGFLPLSITDALHSTKLLLPC